MATLLIIGFRNISKKLCNQFSLDFDGSKLQKNQLKSDLLRFFKNLSSWGFLVIHVKCFAKVEKCIQCIFASTEDRTLVF